MVMMSQNLVPGVGYCCNRTDYVASSWQNGDFNLGLMGHTSRRMKDSGVVGVLNCRVPDQEVSEEKNVCM